MCLQVGVYASICKTNKTPLPSDVAVPYMTQSHVDPHSQTVFSWCGRRWWHCGASVHRHALVEQCFVYQCFTASLSVRMSLIWCHAVCVNKQVHWSVFDFSRSDICSPFPCLHTHARTHTRTQQARLSYTDGVCSFECAMPHLLFFFFRIKGAGKCVHAHTFTHIHARTHSHIHTHAHIWGREREREKRKGGEGVRYYACPHSQKQGRPLPGCACSPVVQ
jgi:hypothetical protein